MFLFREGEKKDVTASVLPDLNHLFMQDTDGSKDGPLHAAHSNLQERRWRSYWGHSVRIVSREVIRGPRREHLGEEVIVVFPTSDEGNGVASLFHVSQSEYLVQITSNSLQNIIDFRDDYRSAR